MEVVTMHPSHHHTHMDPSYMGQAPNMFLTGLGGQQVEEKEQSLQSSSGLQRTQNRPAPQNPFTPQHSDYPDDVMDSPDLSNVSWEDFAATSWDAHARMLESQQGHPQPGHIIQLQMPPGRSYVSSKAASSYQQTDHPLLSAHSILSATSPMEYSLSASTSPGPEIVPQEAFTSPLTPASFDPEPPSQMAQARNNQQSAHHRHMRSTPSPHRPTASPEILRRKSAPTSSKSGSVMGKIAKNASPKSAPTSNPTNARSAHSAIERKYRENINNKIAELHKVLCTAGPPLFADQDVDAGGYPYSRLPRNDEDEYSGVDSSSTSGQAVLPAKKADVLAGAISYVKRSEKEKKLLVDQLNSVTAQLQHFEALVQGRGGNLA